MGNPTTVASEIGATRVQAQRGTVKTHRWYFGGLASAGAACVTHPLDLVKVLALAPHLAHGYTPLSWEAGF